MVIRFRCHHCAGLLKAPDDAADMVAACAKCGYHLTIPRRSDPSLMAVRKVVSTQTAPSPSPWPTSDRDYQFDPEPELLMSDSSQDIVFASIDQPATPPLPPSQWDETGRRVLPGQAPTEKIPRIGLIVLAALVLGLITVLAGIRTCLATMIVSQQILGVLIAIGGILLISVASISYWLRRIVQELCESRSRPRD
jgi:hypothetical protein